MDIQRTGEVVIQWTPTGLQTFTAAVVDGEPKWIESKANAQELRLTVLTT